MAKYSFSEPAKEEYLIGGWILGNTGDAFLKRC
jgi:hypothetical protein